MMSGNNCIQEKQDVVCFLAVENVEGMSDTET